MQVSPSIVFEGISDVLQLYQSILLQHRNIASRHQQSNLYSCWSWKQKVSETSEACATFLKTKDEWKYENQQCSLQPALQALHDEEKYYFINTVGLLACFKRSWTWENVYANKSFLFHLISDVFPVLVMFAISLSLCQFLYIHCICILQEQSTILSRCMVYDVYPIL